MFCVAESFGQAEHKWKEKLKTDTKQDINDEPECIEFMCEDGDLIL